MMRAAILALCLVGVLAADDKFVDHRFEVLINSTSPGTDTMSITYSIKKPASFKPGNPVFYGTGGRVSIEDLKSQYDLFNSVIPDFDNATVVFVEQRYFGNSQSSKAIKTVADLAQLKLDNVVADHVALIKKLSADLKTRNFMIFGGGHGGLIAGYLTKHFNDGKDKTVTGFNVMGWSSSPPIKYVRRQNVDTDIAIAHQIGPQFSAVLKGAVSTCHPEYLQNLFQKLKAAATDANFVGPLWLAPTPAVSGAADASDDIKELSIFIRNQLLGLTFADGLPYIPATNQLNPERILKVLCDKINALDTAAHTTTDNINALLGVLGASATSKLRWKVTNDGFGKINRDLVWQAYQDCTEYQIAYCQPADPGTGDDPFSGSSWVSGACDDKNKLGATIQAGCTGIFRSLLSAGTTNFDVSGTQLNKDTYPVALGGFRVLTTINPMSVFGTEPTTQGFGDTDKGKYASFLKVGFTDNWEFRQPRGCDGDTTKKVRYMALRAFGCLGNFITDKAGKKDICKDPTKLFDIATTADPTTFPGTCAVDGSKFPFGQDELKFVDPYYKPPTTTTLASTQAQTTVSTTTKGGAGFIPSMMIVLTSGLLVWFTGL